MKSPIQYPFLKIVALVFLLLGFLICTSQTTIAQKSACDLEQSDKKFGELSDKVDKANGDQQVFTEVLNSARSYINSAFETRDPDCAAKAVFGAVNLASRIPSGHLLTQYTSDSIYAFRTSSTDSSDLAFFFFSAGILEFSRGDRAAARIWFDSTLSIPRALHAGDSYASAVKVRGFVNKYDKRYEDALSDFAHAEALYQKYHHNDLKAQIDIASARAEVMVERGDKPETVLGNIEKAIKLYESKIDRYEEWRDAYSIYLSYARVLSGLGRYKDAEKAGKKALEITARSGDKFRSAIVHGAIAGRLVAAERLEEARESAIKSYEMFESISKRSHMAETLEQLISIETKLGAYKSALEYSTILVAVRDSLYQTSQVTEIRSLQQIQAQQETLSELALERANGRMLIAEQSQARMKLWFSIVALLVVLSVLLILVSRLRARKKTHVQLEKLVETRTAELQKHAKNLEEKNTELERFAYIASHDLKTPLRNITSFINLANKRMSPQTKSEIGEYLEFASTYANQMDYLVCDVLEFSKIEKKKILKGSRCELRFIVDRAVKISLPEFEHKNPLITVDGNAEIFCDRDYVEQILFKLIHNALKFNDSVIPRINIQIGSDVNSGVEICISDNGIGIEQEYRETIFDLFRRLNLQDKYPGTGLGLSIARKLARRIGGDICLEQSTHSSGSTFVLRLPNTQSVGKQRGQQLEKGV